MECGQCQDSRKGLQRARGEGRKYGDRGSEGTTEEIGRAFGKRYRMFRYKLAPPNGWDFGLCYQRASRPRVFGIEGVRAREEL